MQLGPHVRRAIARARYSRHAAIAQHRESKRRSSANPFFDGWEAKPPNLSNQKRCTKCNCKRCKHQMVLGRPALFSGKVSAHPVMCKNKQTLTLRLLEVCRYAAADSEFSVADSGGLVADSLAWWAIPSFTHAYPYATKGMPRKNGS